MSVEKLPITDKEFNSILGVAVKHSEEATKILLLLRYTGMHVSIMVKPNFYKLRTEDNFILWSRTKKDGKQAHTQIIISTNINFNVQEFIDDLKKRKRKCSRQYFYNIVKEVGEQAGIRDLSPMSLRHLAAVSMLDAGYPEAFVQQTLNCSDRVLKTYVKYSKGRGRTLFEKIGW